MPRAWMVSAGVAAAIVVAAMVRSSLGPPEAAAAAAADPCFSYGRFECCVRP
jgi:hypothetical protein